MSSCQGSEWVGTVLFTKFVLEISIKLRCCDDWLSISLALSCLDLGIMILVRTTIVSVMYVIHKSHSMQRTSIC